MKKYYIPMMMLVFVALSAIFFGMRTYVPEFNFPLLMTGNIIMFGLSVLSFFMVMNQLKRHPAAFVRGVYGASFLKLFVCIVGIITYAILKKPDIHKPSLFVLLGIYAVYSAVETVVLSGLARKV